MTENKRTGTGFRLLLAGLAAVLTVLPAWTHTARAADAKTADLVYANWEEGIAYTHLAQAVLEDKLGYTVTITAADVAPAYAAVAQGDKDAFMETWLPVLHKDYMERYKNDVIDLGHVFEGTESGLVVPRYMVEAGTKEEIFSHPVHPYTKSLLSAIPHPNPEVEKRRKSITYDYASSGIDYAKGMQHLVGGTHTVLATDAELAQWTQAE